MRLTALALLAATLILSFSRFTVATTVNANSVSQSDVAAAIGSAVDGDTVTIPAGTATWTRTLPVTKAITLQGAGIGATIIRDNASNVKLIDGAARLSPVATDQNHRDRVPRWRQSQPRRHRAAYLH